MARKPMVTRTFQTTHATFMCVDTVSAEVCNETVTLPRTYKDDKALLKAGKAIIEKGNIKVVAVVDVTVSSELFGMDEATFIANATILDPETRKVYESENHTEDEA